MSEESYLVIMYIQVLAFTLVVLALAYYYAAQHHRKGFGQELEMEEATDEEGEIQIAADNSNFIDVIYEQTHKEESKITDVRLHGKHKK